MKLTKKQLEWCQDNLPVDRSDSFAPGWKVNSQGKVDVEGHINIRFQNFKKFPVSFGKVNGEFDCHACEYLISLEGAPEEITGDFGCSSCTSLTSLEGAPREVTGDFSCNDCTSLTSLEGAPQVVTGEFECTRCTSLDPFHVQIIADYNTDELDWPTAHKLIHRPKLSKAHSLGLI